MIVEVVTRLLALGKLFWKSIFNIVDISLVLLCVITLLFIISGGCSHKGEEVFDLILLVVRNFVQFGRLIVMVTRNKENRKARNATVDFTNVRDPSVSIDIDYSAYSWEDDDNL
jgi:hypothetical protein